MSQDTKQSAIEAAAFAILMTEEGWCLNQHAVPERAALNLARAAAPDALGEKP